MSRFQPLELSLWAGLAAVGFAVLFHVPRRALPACALGGALGFCARYLLVEYHLASTELASLLSATLVSAFAVLLGRRLRAPAVIFVIPGVIPLVPGALAFRTMLDLLALTTAQGPENPALLTSIVTNAIRTGLITGAMACGVAVPSLLLRHKRAMT